MKNGKLVLFVVILIIVTISCNFLLPNNQPHVADINTIGQNVINLPILDPEAPLPSPGAVQLRTLPAGGPDITALIGDVEAAEQAALKAGVADLKAKMPVSNTPQKLATLSTSPWSTSTYLIPSPSRQHTSGDTLLVSYNKQDVFQQAEGTLSPASVIGLLSSMLTDMFNVPTAFPTKSFTQSETKGDATSNMSMEIGRSEDGSNHFGLGLKSEGTKNGASVKTDLSATIDGQRCPTAEGQVSFSIKARIGSESGGAGTTQDLTTFVRVVVNDDAEITSSTFDVIQGTTHVKGGRQVYVETGETIKFGSNYTGVKESNWRVNQKTDNATQEDFNNLEPDGLKAALELGIASLASAQNSWQNGKCVKIVATSPGTVEAGSTTTIPINVISIFEGSNAPSKIMAALTGAESIEPSTLAKTPGNLSYTAPNEDRKSATITLTATSRRGKATLQLPANTGALTAYMIDGGEGDWQTKTAVCDIMKPFTLTGDIITQKYSGGLSGTYTFTGSMYNLHGSGTYTISLPYGAGKGGHMTSHTTGFALGNKGSATGEFTLLQLDPGAACTQ